jgi:hypothetical protein
MILNILFSTTRSFAVDHSDVQNIYNGQIYNKECFSNSQRTA